MAYTSTAPASQTTPAASRTAAVADTGSYVDWAAIIAGALLALAVSVIMLAFGSAIGLSLASPYTGEGSAIAFVIAAGLWFAWVHVSSFLAGGYLAGRLRRRVGDATAHEVEVRDGAHGVLVWALGGVLAGLVAAYTAGGAVTAATHAVSAAAKTDIASYYIDSLFRSETIPGDMTTEAARQEATRIVANAMTGTLPAADRTYLAKLITARTGLQPADAEARIDQVLAQAKAAADKARKYGILLAFLTAATMLVGAAAAWWSATRGGRHRDEGTDFSHVVRWR